LRAACPGLYAATGVEKPHQASTALRKDIQGLRALAVLLVLVFHVWPRKLQGGYVGVDVFFTISGFLITRLLFREFVERGTLSLSSFYARRVRRLLPAASLTLAAVSVAAVLWLPRPQLGEVALEVLASALYVENLVLVDRSVDYLAQDADPSPVQHYWSLSVEEQFYILWPLLLVAVGWFLRADRRKSRGAVTVTLASVVVGSLACALVYARTAPAPGYFLTTTRIWELGLGGLLALAGERLELPSTARAVLGWAGILAIVTSAILFTTEVAFPAHRALLPTLGAIAIMAANVGERSALGWVLGNRAMVYVGDVSYSLYLWHWPIMVFFPYVLHRDRLMLRDQLAIVALSFVCAHLSKTYVEERFRHPPAGQPARAGALALGLACTLLAVGLAALPYLRAPALATEDLAALRSDPRYPGARAFTENARVPPKVPFVPSLDKAHVDNTSRAYKGKDGKPCVNTGDGTRLTVCPLGRDDSKFHVVLVGDSHALHWFPAFSAAALLGDWKVSGLAKMGCAFTDMVVIRGGQQGPETEFKECRGWTDEAMAWIAAQKPDAVIVSYSSHHKILGVSLEESQPRIADATLSLVRKLEGQGIDVGTIRHTPWSETTVAAKCLAKRGATFKKCTRAARDVLKDAALGIAARRYAPLRELDFTDAFCRRGQCPPVIGNVLVYRDRHHMTGAYSYSLGRTLYQRIQAKFPRSR
jgi:peptidoglycan/LPS O-acetylase OafA/YrhL